jgi:hypothetical protein
LRNRAFSVAKSEGDAPLTTPKRDGVAFAIIIILRQIELFLVKMTVASYLQRLSDASGQSVH